MKHKYLNRGIFTAVVLASIGVTQPLSATQYYYPTIIEYSLPTDIAEMEAEGIIVLRHRDNMALTFVPYSESADAAAGAESADITPRLKKIKGVRAIERSRKAVPAMDIARSYYDASLINEGSGLPSPYTGKGIVVGFCDIGFDPDHINFKDINGDLRVKRLVQYKETTGERIVLNSPEEIINWGTDYAGTFHATHVAGIIAGKAEDSPYTGMAPDAEIVAVTSSLYDVSLLAGAEDIIEYATSQGKPCVINMSVGSYTGPHDGSSLFNRYLASLGREAIICMASGNEGNSNNVIRCNFTDNRTLYRARIHSSDWTQLNMYGTVDCWSDDDSPLRIQFNIMNEEQYATGVHDGEMVYQFPIADSSSDFYYLITSDTDAEFAKYYTGYVEIYGGLEPRNGRRYVTINFEATTDIKSSRGEWSKYVFVIEAEGDPGTNADLYADSVYTRFNGYTNYPGRTSERSVSDLATGDNIICVGMYNNRNTLPNLDGTERTTSDTPGYVNVCSGFGTLLDGRVLPNTVAPGGSIVSSYSSKFMESNPSFMSRVCHTVEKDGTTYYWGNEGGTSMSTPYVAGCIATWLEANPQLNVDDVKDILSTTNHTDYQNNPADPRHGEGWFSPYQGVLAAIQKKGIGSGVIITEDYASPRLSYSSEGLRLWNPSQTAQTVEIFNISGIKVYSAASSDSTSLIPVKHLPGGIYTVRVSGTPVSLKLRI